MKRYKRYFKESYLDFHITDEMISWFKERTLRHIELVKEYGHKIEDVLLNKDDQWKQRFRYNLDTHDSIKFEDPEYEPYIIITWNYKCKDNGVTLNISESDFNLMNIATEHHVKHSEHHPEFWSDRENVIPKNDRDKFDANIIPTIEISNMPFMALCEMVADWCAMSKERGNTPKEWADKVIGKRWSFPEKQVKQIYKLIDLVW
jgi:hypothetical protein